MDYKLFTLPFVMMLSLLSCQNLEVSHDYILSEKDLIPEGLAFDQRSQTIYVGATYKRKIVQIDPTGEISDFVPEEWNGMWSPVGMEVDTLRDLLWVNTAHANEVMPLMHPDTARDWMTGVMAINISERRIVKSYLLDDPKAFLNDLSVLPNGDVIITESVNNGLYRITSAADTIETLLKPEGFHFLNGITYAPDQDVLFVSSVEGILKVDIQERSYILLPSADSIKPYGIDGLAYRDGYLIGHMDEIYKFHLNESHTAITKAEIIDSGDEFDSSTTGELGIDHYYYIVNSQINSGVDYELRTVKPLDSLENVIIRKRRL